MSHTLPDIQIGDLWRSDKNKVTVLVLGVYHDGEEWIADFFDIRDFLPFRYSIWMIENKKSSYYLISRC